METSLYNRIQRYIFPYIDSNMYILAENGEALVIDPHISSEADRYLKENHVGKVTIVLTHEHFDHICGVPWFREHYNTNVICQQEAVDPKRQKHFCRPLVVSLVLADRGEYDKIKKVVSIWICEDTAMKRSDTINEYRVAERCRRGDYQEPPEDYDLMRVVVMRLGIQGEKSEDDAIRLLSKIFSPTRSAKEKEAILENEFHNLITAAAAAQQANMEQSVFKKKYRAYLQ